MRDILWTREFRLRGQLSSINIEWTKNTNCANKVIRKKCKNGHLDTSMGQGQTKCVVQ